MSKRTGALYEAKFVVKALEHGLDPHPCPGEYMPHDFLVTNAAGQVIKTQVKGTACADANNRKNNRYKVLATTGNKVKTAIDCTKVDLLAAYVEPEDAWYVIPCMQLSAKTIWLYPGNPKSVAMYEKYRDRWNLFKGEV